MTRQEIDKIWAQAVLHALDFEKIMNEKGWAKSTLAKYCGVGMPKMNQYLVGFEGTKEEMEKILTGLKAHGVIHAVREAKKAAAEAIEGLDYDLEMYGEETDGFEGNPDNVKFSPEIVENTEKELEHEEVNQMVEEHEKRENIETLIADDAWGKYTDDAVKMNLIREFYSFNAITDRAIMVNVYQLDLIVFGEPLTRWLTVTADERVNIFPDKALAFAYARGELMRDDQDENDN